MLLANARILADDMLLDGYGVLIEGGRIAAILPEAAWPAGPREDLDGMLLAPGFIDVQVNGGGGVMFNDAPTVEGIAAIAAAHRRFGTTGMLPTLISDDLAVVDRAIDAVAAAIAQGVPGVLGIHLEGPFLNPQRQGIHDPAYFRTLDDATIERIARPTGGVTMVTLAPERAPPGAIRTLVSRGVVVMAGHTAATYDQTLAALEEGLAGFTHLFNAMTPFGSREPGVVGAALEDAASWCGLIVDGHHVHPASMRVALAAKPRGRVFLVTDAMSTVGSAEERFSMGDVEITLADGRLTGPDGTLAGSHLDMAEAVRNAQSMLGLTQAEAIALASAAPAALLGQWAQRGRIAEGLAADLVLLDREGRVARSWIGGVEGQA